ncbi:MAG TPA: hypothetical protein VMS31_14040 [Pyrinomonadaceae bacterium]|nr:hypothetical protein [Pyrinomonadaceae bacterium]
MKLQQWRRNLDMSSGESVELRPRRTLENISNSKNSIGAPAGPPAAVCSFLFFRFSTCGAALFTSIVLGVSTLINNHLRTSAAGSFRTRIGRIGYFVGFSGSRPLWVAR